jgi:hypothetical protein
LRSRGGGALPVVGERAIAAEGVAQSAGVETPLAGAVR